MSIPDEVVDKIDEFIDTNDWGYRSRPEVITAAVRAFLQEEEERRGGWKARSSKD